MKNKKIYMLSGIIIIHLLAGCISSPSYTLTENSFIYNDINFGSNRNKNFKLGVMDACHTANGVYTKNHKKFNSNASYRVGWKLGRLKCKGKQ
jgi:hypothetical protein